MTTVMTIIMTMTMLITMITMIAMMTMMIIIAIRKIRKIRKVIIRKIIITIRKIIMIIITIIMQTFIQDILHTYTYTYVHRPTVVNNSSVTHKVRCYPTLVTARKEYTRTHPILTALIGIYTKYLQSIVSPAVYTCILRLQDCLLDYRYCYALWQIWKIGRYKKFI